MRQAYICWMQYVHSKDLWKYWLFHDGSILFASRCSQRMLEHSLFHIGRKVASGPRMFRSAGSAPVSAITTGLRLMDERDARTYPQVVPSPRTGGKMAASIYEN